MELHSPHYNMHLKRVALVNVVPSAREVRDETLVESTMQGRSGQESGLQISTFQT